MSSIITCNVPGLANNDVHDNILLVAVLLHDGNLNVFSVIKQKHLII